MYYMYTGMKLAQMLDGPTFESPLLFVEKQVFAVEIPNAFMFEGDRLGIPYTYCEVYAPFESRTNVCMSSKCYTFHFYH